MNVVDSSAWLSYFADDVNAKHFAGAIETLDKLLVPTITLTEVFKAVMRQRSENLAFEVIAHMQQGKVIDLDSAIALDAAACSLQYKLPLADSIIYATARKFNATVWTQDVDFKGLEKIRFFPKKR